MNVNLLNEYNDQGYCYLRNSVDLDLIKNIEENICQLILATVKRLSIEKQKEFYKCKFNRDQLPHGGLIKLYELSPKFQQIVVDALVVSSSVYRLLLDKNLSKKIAMLIGSKIENMVINEVNVRVDLPSIFKALTLKIELPAHQESSYFRKNIDPINGAVVWIPLYDCGPTEGSLEIFPQTHKLGDIEHSGKYLNPLQKKHFRNTVSPEILKKYNSIRLNTKKGDCVIQHFALIHKTAYNLHKNRVRYTLLLRTANLLSQDFIPTSW